MDHKCITEYKDSLRYNSCFIYVIFTRIINVPHNMRMIRVTIFFRSDSRVQPSVVYLVIQGIIVLHFIIFSSLLLES